MRDGSKRNNSNDFRIGCVLRRIHFSGKLWLKSLASYCPWNHGWPHLKLWRSTIKSRFSGFSWIPPLRPPPLIFSAIISMKNLSTSCIKKIFKFYFKSFKIRQERKWNFGFRFRYFVNEESIRKRIPDEYPIKAKVISIFSTIRTEILKAPKWKWLPSHLQFQLETHHVPWPGTTDPMPKEK